MSEKGKNPIVVSRKSGSIWASNVAKNLLGLEIVLGGTYRSAINVDARNIYQVPAYLVVDASMRYQLPTSNKDMWKIGLFVKT